MLEARLFSWRDRRFRAMLDRGLDTDIDAVHKTAEIVKCVRDDAESELARSLSQYHSPSGDALPYRVTCDEMDKARQRLSEAFLTALSLARVNARKFHEHQRRKGYVADDNDGVIMSRQVRALGRIGIYCGRSFATLLTHAVPAQVAGVGQIVVAAAPEPDGDIDPRILATARILGLDEVYRLSGAHAVAAMAYGVDFLPRVDKIFGSDDTLAGTAKHLLAKTVGAVSGLGSGDLAIVADASANARFIASDFLAQAEIEEEGQIVALFITDRLLAEAVRIETERLVHRFANAQELRRRLDERAAVFLCPDLDTAVRAVNALAPARLSLATRHNDACLSEVETAGSVFVGQWSAEAAGGYFSGVNPRLPVGGSARFRAGLGVEDFIREMTVVEFGPDRLLRTGRHQALLASEEGLIAQAESVRERLEFVKLAVE